MIPSDISPYVPSYVGDQIANAASMTFDSTSSTYFNAGTTLNSMLEIGDSFSISAWVNFGNTSTDRTIISNFTSSIKGIQLRVLNNESIRIIIAESSSKYLFVDSTSLATNTWHHIAATYDGSNTIGGLNLYINSSLDNNTNSAGATITTITSTDSLKIGAYTSGHYFDGKIDEVAIFNYALNAGQIYNDIYLPTKSGTGLTANLDNNPNLTAPVAWYRMGD
tara:strand:- start:823 stop:1488 length:666 start_codon:yes stop_codon:yes gene_type:complete